MPGVWGFTFLGTEYFVFLPVHVPELFVTQFSDLDPWKQIGLTLGQCFPEGSTCGPMWAPFSTLAARDSPWSWRTLEGAQVLSIPGYCVLSTELWGNPLSSSFVLGLCPPSWHHILEAPPMSQALLDHLYLFFYGMLSRTAQGTLSKSHYFIYFIFCL